jgi:hypothetical protein
MKTTAIREKLANYLKVADEKKLKAIYTMVEDEINTQANDWDPDFIGELEKRSKAGSKPSGKTYTWEQTKRAAMKRVKSKFK